MPTGEGNRGRGGRGGRPYDPERQEDSRGHSHDYHQSQNSLEKIPTDDPLVYVQIHKGNKWEKVPFKGHIKQERLESLIIINEHNPVVHRPNTEVYSSHVQQAVQEGEGLSDELKERWKAEQKMESIAPRFDRGEIVHVEGAVQHKKTDDKDPLGFFGKGIYKQNIDRNGKSVPLLIQYIGLPPKVIEIEPESGLEKMGYPEQFTDDAIVLGQLSVTRHDRLFPKEERFIYAINGDWKERMEAGMTGAEQRTPALLEWMRYVDILRKAEYKDVFAQDELALSQESTKFKGAVTRFMESFERVKATLQGITELPHPDFLIDEYGQLRRHLSIAFNTIDVIRNILSFVDPKKIPAPPSADVLSDAIEKIISSDDSDTGVELPVHQQEDVRSNKDVFSIPVERVQRKLFLKNIQDARVSAGLLSEDLHIIDKSKEGDQLSAQTSAAELIQAARAVHARFNALFSGFFERELQEISNAPKGIVTISKEMAERGVELRSLTARANKIHDQLNDALDEIIGADTQPAAPEPAPKQQVEPDEDIPPTATVPAEAVSAAPLSDTPIESLPVAEPPAPAVPPTSPDRAPIVLSADPDEEVADTEKPVEIERTVFLETIEQSRSIVRQLRETFHLVYDTEVGEKFLAQPDGPGLIDVAHEDIRDIQQEFAEGIYPEYEEIEASTADTVKISQKCSEAYEALKEGIRKAESINKKINAELDKLGKVPPAIIPPSPPPAPDPEPSRRRTEPSAAEKQEARRAEERRLQKLLIRAVTALSVEMRAAGFRGETDRVLVRAWNARKNYQQEQRRLQEDPFFHQEPQELFAELTNIRELTARLRELNEGAARRASAETRESLFERLPEPAEADSEGEEVEQTGPIPTQPRSFFGELGRSVTALADRFMAKARELRKRQITERIYGFGQQLTEQWKSVPTDEPTWIDFELSFDKQYRDVLNDMKVDGVETYIAQQLEKIETSTQPKADANGDIDYNLWVRQEVKELASEERRLRDIHLRFPGALQALRAMRKNPTYEQITMLPEMHAAQQEAAQALDFLKEAWKTLPEHRKDRIAVFEYAQPQLDHILGVGQAARDAGVLDAHWKRISDQAKEKAPDARGTFWKEQARQLTALKETIVRAKRQFDSKGGMRLERQQQDLEQLTEEVEEIWEKIRAQNPSLEYVINKYLTSSAGEYFELIDDFGKEHPWEGYMRYITERVSKRLPAQQTVKFQEAITIFQDYRDELDERVLTPLTTLPPFPDKKEEEKKQPKTRRRGNQRSRR